MAPRKKAAATPAQEQPQLEVEEVGPSVDGLQGEHEHPFAQLAKKYWLKPVKRGSKAKVVKIKPDVLKTEIWDVLEKDRFAFKNVLVLENLQILEKYGRLRQP